VDKLNDEFGKEFKTGKAGSDETLADSRDLKRRTVTKYRTLGGVPCVKEREIIYACGQLKGPYRIITPLEEFFLDPSKSMTNHLVRVALGEYHGKRPRNSESN